MPLGKLTFSPRHLQGLLTALGKRAFNGSAKEQQENEAYSNEALLSQMGMPAETETEIVIIEVRPAYVVCTCMYACIPFRHSLHPTR